MEINLLGNEIRKNAVYSLTIYLDKSGIDFINLKMIEKESKKILGRVPAGAVVEF